MPNPSDPFPAGSLFEPNTLESRTATPPLVLTGPAGRPETLVPPAGATGDRGAWEPPIPAVPVDTVSRTHLDDGESGPGPTESAFAVPRTHAHDASGPKG